MRVWVQASGMDATAGNGRVQPKAQTERMFVLFPHLPVLCLCAEPSVVLSFYLVVTFTALLGVVLGLNGVVSVPCDRAFAAVVPQPPPLVLEVRVEASMPSFPIEVLRVRRQKVLVVVFVLVRASLKNVVFL